MLWCMIDSEELLIGGVSLFESIHHVLKEKYEKNPSASMLLSMSVLMALIPVLQMKFAQIQMSHSPAAVLPDGKDQPEAVSMKMNAQMVVISARTQKFVPTPRDRTIVTLAKQAL